MRSKLKIVLTMLILCVFGVLNTGIKVDAETYGDFEYQLINDSSEVEITKYKGTATEVTIPDKIDEKNVTSIGESAFSGCNSLTSVSIDNGLKTIGRNSFASCELLESISLPDTLEEIDVYAFVNCISLTSVTIGPKVEFVSDWSFQGCSSLENIFVDDENPKYSSEDGVLFSKLKKTLLIYPAGKKEASYTVPDTVKLIECMKNTNVKTITIPEGVNYISNEAFEYNQMDEIVFPSMVVEILQYALPKTNNITFLNPKCSIVDLQKDYYEWYLDKENVVISGYNNSTAQAFAQEHGFTFESLGDCNFDDFPDTDSVEYPHEDTDIVEPSPITLYDEEPNSENDIIDWENSYSIKTDTGSIEWHLVLKPEYRNTEDFLMVYNFIIKYPKKDDRDIGWTYIYPRKNSDGTEWVGTYSLTQYGLNGSYDLVAYSYQYQNNNHIIGAIEDEMKIEINGLLSDTDNPVIDLSKARVFSEGSTNNTFSTGEYIRFLIPVTDKTSGIRTVWITIYQILDDTHCKYCYSMNIDTEHLTEVEDGYIFSMSISEPGTYMVMDYQGMDQCRNMVSVNIVDYRNDDNGGYTYEKNSEYSEYFDQLTFTVSQSDEEETGTYNVTFKTDKSNFKGTGETECTKKVKYNESVGSLGNNRPSVMACEGYKFVGWKIAGDNTLYRDMEYEDKELPENEKHVWEYVVTKDVTFEAVWEQLPEQENPKKPTEQPTKEKTTEQATTEATKVETPTSEDKTVATQIPAVKDTILTDESTKATFVVTSSAGEEPTVEYKEATDVAEKTVNIPGSVTIDGVTYKVTEIADDAFANNKTVEKVVISNNIETIGDSAFEGCKKLKSVTVGSNVTEIGDNAFANCSALTKITIPAKVKKLGKNAFKGNKKLKTIIIKSKKLTTKTIAKNAFKGVTNKVTIKVPKGKKKTYNALFRKKGLSKKVKIK